MCNISKNRTAPSSRQANSLTQVSLNERMAAQVQKEKRRGSHRMRILCSQHHWSVAIHHLAAEYSHMGTHLSRLSPHKSKRYTLRVCLCVCKWVRLCWRRSLPQRDASPMKEKFVFEHVPYTHTHTHTYVLDLEKEGYGEVRRGKAICKSIWCVKINFLLRDFESHNSLAFPGQFPSDTCS